MGIVTNWKSRWLDRRRYQQYLEEDYTIREYLLKKLDRISIYRIEIERFSHKISVIIYTSRPGLLIGRGGAGAEELKRDIENLILRLSGTKPEIRIEVQEVKNPQTHARLAALGVADQLERRRPFRRVLKRTIETISSHKDVRGIKIMIAGRLNGAEMARREWLSWGALPLQNLRANIDYDHVMARTAWGAIGVKVWIYKGEVFGEKEEK